jgi:hypothetical protein
MWYPTRDGNFFMSVGKGMAVGMIVALFCVLIILLSR